jgi:hypothetical protein
MEEDPYAFDETLIEGRESGKLFMKMIGEKPRYINWAFSLDSQGLHALITIAQNM